MMMALFQTRRFISGKGNWPFHLSWAANSASAFMELRSYPERLPANQTSLHARLFPLTVNTI
jgi:hypothetical protein